MIRKKDKSYILIFVAAIIVAMSLRLVYAQLVYHDLKCAIAECRISK